MFRNSNDVKDNKFKQTTGHWNPFTKSIMMAQSGFPDFICLKDDGTESFDNTDLVINFKVRFIECKGGDEKHKYLDKTEKEKVEWIKQNLKIPFFIASKGEKRGDIIYE